jgi:hypothetical protein
MIVSVEKYAANKTGMPAKDHYGQTMRSMDCVDRAPCKSNPTKVKTEAMAEV